MSLWDEAFKKKPEPAPKVSVEIYGSFQCQSCGLETYVAYYTPEEQLLEYTCSNGHKSRLEKFKLNV